MQKKIKIKMGFLGVCTSIVLWVGSFAMADNSPLYSFDETTFLSVEDSYVLLDPVGNIEGRAVSKGELNAYLYVFEDLEINEVDHPMIAEQLLRQRGVSEMLAQEARKRGLDADPEFQMRVKLWSDRHLIELLHRDKLAKNELDLEKERQEYEAAVAQREKQEFNVSHIYTESSEDADAMIKAITGGDKTFEEIEKEVFLDSEEGGYLGWFTLSQVDAQFSEAIRSTEVGNISATPVKTDYGYHIIRVNAIRDVEIPAFEALNLFEIGQPAFQKYVESVQETIKIELPEAK